MTYHLQTVESDWVGPAPWRELLKGSRTAAKEATIDDPAQLYTTVAERLPIYVYEFKAIRSSFCALLYLGS